MFLSALRCSWSVELLDLLLRSGILQQQEVNRNRPTVHVAAALNDQAVRDELLSTVEIPSSIVEKIRQLLASPSTGQPLRNPTTPGKRDPDRTQAGPPQTPPSLSSSSQLPPSPNLLTHLQKTTATTVVAKKADAVSVHRPDWHWTLELLRAGYQWNVVCAMRRMSDEQLSSDCCEALRAGGVIERSWLTAHSGDIRTQGQQRVMRELQRRASAGV
mgnify:CR=1 FL=1